MFFQSPRTGVMQLGGLRGCGVLAATKSPSARRCNVDFIFSFGLA